jgi:hypothetical protein
MIFGEALFRVGIVELRMSVEKFLLSRRSFGKIPARLVAHI